MAVGLAPVLGAVTRLPWPEVVGLALLPGAATRLPWPEAEGRAPFLGVAVREVPLEEVALPFLGWAWAEVATARRGFSLKAVLPYPFKGAPTLTDPLAGTTYATLE